MGKKEKEDHLQNRQKIAPKTKKCVEM